MEGAQEVSGGTARLGYMPALDGIRAVAMVAIMTYHGGFSWARGTFLSVDAFFVLSGFLITSLLVREWGKTRAIDLGTFWANRARRLLPGLLLLLAGIAVYAVVVAPADTRSPLRLDALSTLFYVGNWHQILAGQSYFAQSAFPSPLLHTWTLAIEEQFYLVWPLVVLAVLRRTRSLRPLLVLTGLAIVASAVDMALLFHPGTDTSRVYYGTDTRAQSLLIGAALALVLVIRGPVTTDRGRRACSGVALAAVVGLGWAWTSVDNTSPLLYRGGWALVGLAVAAVLVGVVEVPGSLLARALSPRPLRYLGKISYGTYLWYQPTWLVLDHARTGLTGYPLFGGRVAVTYVLAATSYHLVEMPVRRGALRRLELRSRLRRLPPAAWNVAVGAVVVTAVFVATTPVSASAPRDPVSAQHAYPDAGTAFGATSFEPGGTSKVEFFGDSLSLTLAFGMREIARTYAIAPRSAAVVGCGIAVGSPLNDLGVVTDQFPDCPAWAQHWRSEIGSWNPDVAVMLVGRWEAVDRFHDGRWEHIGQADYDAYLTAQLEQAVSILGARGAKVVFLTSPYFFPFEEPNGGIWPQEDPARVDRFNTLLSQVVSRHPGVVTLVPFGSWLSPGGRYTETIDGVQVRSSDGVHLTAAGDLWLAPKLLPELVQLGQDRIHGH